MDERTLRRIKVLDGLHFSFRLLEYHHQAMYPACSAIPTDKAQLIPALASCWAFIDVLHRLRELSQVIPGLSRKLPELRRFLERTALAEQCRHYIQHLRSELGRPSPEAGPVWGSISWVDPGDSSVTYTVMFGARLPNTSYTGAVFDTVERRWVSRVCLGVRDWSFNFDPLFEETMVFERFVMPWMLTQDGDRVNVSADLPIFTTRFVVNDV
jgi:hypothetical protein